MFTSLTSFSYLKSMYSPLVVVLTGIFGVYFTFWQARYLHQVDWCLLQQCYSPTSTSCKYAEIQWGCRAHLHALLVIVVSPSKFPFPPITARAFMRPYKLKGTHDTYLHTLHLPQSSFRTHPIHFPHFPDCFGMGAAIAYSSFWHSRYLPKKVQINSNSNHI